jgi:two-component system, OmpR family, response regulator CpxR
MSALTVFGGIFCRKEQIVQKLSEKTGYRVLSDQDMVQKAAHLSGMPENKIQRIFSDKISVFNKFTHEKERSLAYLRLAVAEALSSEDSILIDGFTGILAPKGIQHILRICLIADMKSRIPLALALDHVTEKETLSRIHQHDSQCAAWVNSLYKIKDPWDASLYDMVIPTDKIIDEVSVTLVDDNLKSEIIQPTANSRKAADDFLLAAKVEVALAREGHTAEVNVRDGSVCLTIHSNVLMLKRLEEELKAIASGIPDVKSVETRIGKGFYQADIYRKYDFDIPSKVLLVDDEREFVQTLSERLLMRDMGSAIAYDGESALNLVREEEPEVMILDLKMPGIDGIEVLQKVKASHPDIEVIILTGHGTEKDKEQCMTLGAFAYLTKPIDIELLSKTLKKANEKINQKKASIES